MLCVGLSTSAVRFLMRTFRNVSMFALGNATFACGVRSACEWSFEEVGGETEVGRRLLAPEPRPLPLLVLAPQTRPRHANRTPSWATFSGIILPETGQLLLCSLQLWQKLQHFRQTRARVQVFWHILLPFYGNSSPGMTRFLGKRTVTSKRSR